MLEYEAALTRILAAMPAAQAERIPLTQAQGRVLAEQIISAMDLPPFDNSAMDGYAVRAEDVRNAAANSPVALRLCGRVAAGEFFDGLVESSQCVRVFTGSALPPGTDAVVMQEDTQVDPARPETIRILDAARPWENVRFRGEDVKRNVIVGKPGEDLRAGRISLLAALGLAEVGVARQPVAGLLATGSELTEPGSPLPPGGIYESNRVGLAALLARAGAVPKVFPLVADTAADTRGALLSAFEQCDVVVTSGGASVGEMDFIKSAFQELGGELQFWKVAIKPGRPFVFGQWRGKFLFGLPGNPVSAFVTFLLLVWPALRRWQGATDTGPSRRMGTLAGPLANPGDRRHFMRVVVDTTGHVRSAGVQASHMLSSLAAANGLVDVPPKTTFAAETVVPVLRWE